MCPLVSIVLPIYNGEQYMRQSIDSILAQTYDNWELLILDDCSTDKTSIIANEYVVNDARIRYYRNDRNLRLPRNLNKGFSLAKGEYLTWTSDDNRYMPDAIESMVSVLRENPEIQFVFSDLNIIDEDGNYVTTQHIPANYAEQIVGNNVVGACFLYTRAVYEKIGDYQHGHLLVEDYDYWQRIFAKYSTAAIGRVLYEYRSHSASLTGTSKECVVNSAYEETIKCNRPIFGKLNIAQKYYFYYALYRCARSQGRKSYCIQYRTFWLLYYVPSRIRRKLYGE